MSQSIIVTKFLGIYSMKLISKMLSVLSLTNAVRLFFVKEVGFARDPPISDFAWFLRLFKGENVLFSLSETN